MMADVVPPPPELALAALLPGGALLTPQPQSAKVNAAIAQSRLVHIIFSSLANSL
jgi:hypothetical protein